VNERANMLRDMAQIRRQRSAKLQDLFIGPVAVLWGDPDFCSPSNPMVPVRG
jgi:hypothetical protein